MHHVRSHHKASNSSKVNLPAPDLRSAKPAALVSMSLKKKGADGVLLGRISKQAAQRIIDRDGLQDLKNSLIFPPLRHQTRNGADLPQILSDTVTVDSDVDNVQHPQISSLVYTSVLDNRYFNLNNEHQSSVPGGFLDKTHTNLLIREKPNLSFLNEGISPKTPDCGLDGDEFALTEEGPFSGERFEECDVYFAPCPENATDDDMRFFANNHRYLAPRPLSTEQNNWQINAIMDF